MDEFLVELDELLKEQRGYIEAAEKLQEQTNALHKKAGAVQMKIHGVRWKIKQHIEKT
jgi:uncharacterized coiled-coil DUF342 family protein